MGTQLCDLEQEVGWKQNPSISSEHLETNQYVGIRSTELSRGARHLRWSKDPREGPDGCPVRASWAQLAMEVKGFNPFFKETSQITRHIPYPLSL